MIRTFIAIELPPQARAALEKISKELQQAQAPVSWVKPGSIHLTLKFLGNIPEEKVAAIGAALRDVASGFRPFRLQPAGCGAFPNVKQMRVVWVGIRGDDDLLKKIQKEVEAAMAGLGFEPEDRPFRAHLTLGRVKGRQHLRALQQAIIANESFQAEDFDVTELVLYKSDLRPEGAVYTPLFKAKLGIGAD